jgi:hypothetical protein
MTSKTSILLIIQQSPGIDYQALLAKVAPNYANLNSARAALSRVLKDAVSFGMVNRQDHQLFLTDKGMAGLKVKMHDKLILKLNQLMKIRSVSANPDPLVQHLSVLLERGKMDPRLLDNARASVNFSVTDLDKVHVGLMENIRHLSYVEKTLETQIRALREMNFPSAHVQTIPDATRTLSTLVSLSGAEEVQLEHPNLDLSQNLSHSLIAGLSTSPKGSRVGIPVHQLSEILSRLPNQEATFTHMRAYMGMLTLELGRENVVVRGPSQLVEKLRKESDITMVEGAQNPLLPAHPLPPLPIPLQNPDEEKEPSMPRNPSDSNE